MQGLADPAEHALPRLGLELFPNVLSGCCWRASSPPPCRRRTPRGILSCSAAVTQGIVPAERAYRASKLATLGVTSFALFVALSAGEGVFQLVLVGLVGARRHARAAAAPPRLWPSRPDELALLTMGTGLATVFAWSAPPGPPTCSSCCPGSSSPSPSMRFSAASRGSPGAAPLWLWRRPRGGKRRPPGRARRAARPRARRGRSRRGRAVSQDVGFDVLARRQDRRGVDLGGVHQSAVRRSAVNRATRSCWLSDESRFTKRSWSGVGNV